MQSILTQDFEDMELTPVKLFKKQVYRKLNYWRYVALPSNNLHKGRCMVQRFKITIKHLDIRRDFLFQFGSRVAIV